MNIKSIQVKGLFGVFDHTINLRNSERITILHGQNGVGKTTVLRIIKALCSFQFYNLSKIYFSHIYIGFNDGHKLTVVKQGDVEHPADLALFFYVDNDNEPIYVFKKIASDGIDDATLRGLIGAPIGSIEDIIDELDQVGPRSWRIIPTGELIGLDEVLNLYADRLPIREDELLKRRVPEQLRLRLQDNSVYLIETQRLVAKGNPKWRYRSEYPRASAYRRYESTEISAVEEISNELKQRIAGALQQSASTAAKLDAQFAYKLITGSRVSEINETDIRQKYAEYKNYNNRLIEAGIFESHYIYDLPSNVLESGDRRALSLYLADVKEKLLPLNDLLNKVLLFVSIINGRFRNKAVVVDRNSGLLFKTSDGNADLLGSDLSSGEQHELVLMYTLLFRVPAGSLIEIDEPELSLHVTWQQRFLDDLKSLSEVANLDFLIATHSPSIINGRLDLTVELDS